MANSHKGEVSFEVGDRSLTLRFDTNAICTAEQDLDLGIDAIVTRLNAGRLTVVRALFRAGLADGVTLTEAGELIDELGFLRANQILTEALAAAFPNADDPADPPPKGGKAGTGKVSS